MIKCLNLCELINDKKIKAGILEKVYDPEYKRVYFGSYFCSQFFLQPDLYKEIIDHFRQTGTGLTLVVPVFTEKDLELGKERIGKILSYGEGCIDEITVNDIGMLYFLKKLRVNCRINTGRLFLKDARDVRVPEFNSRETVSTLLNDPSVFEMTDGVVEIDETNDVLVVDNKTAENRIGVHYPFCYMTTGNICKYASISKRIEKKFRPNQKCNCECSDIYEHYGNAAGKEALSMYRIGRTVYFERKERAGIGTEVNRYIYFPFFEITGLLNDKEKNDEDTCADE